VQDLHYLGLITSKKESKQMENKALKIAKDGRIYTNDGTFEKIGSFHIVMLFLAITQIVDIIVYAIS